MPKTIPLVIHATHEAAAKIGGIGSVLEGLLTAKTYNKQVDRTILVGPMFGWDPVQMERLNSPAAGLNILYSSLHGIYFGVSDSVQHALRSIEQNYQVALLYGVRSFGGAEHEVLLIEASNPDRTHLDRFSYFLWEQFGIDSRRYNHEGEYNLYLSIAQPLFEGIKALGVDAGLAPRQAVIIAHEWLGMPFVFAAQLNEPEQWRTVFYAHEMATARLLVESHEGHDTRFYNTLGRARDSHLPIDTLFGDQNAYFKHAILRSVVHCDSIFAVSDLVKEELRFLGGHFAHCNIDLVYNGTDAEQVSVAERLVSKRRLQQYCRTLLGFKPDYVFTHVARLVLSKAFWRDITVMNHLDGMLKSAGKTAVVLFLATSEPAGRQAQWVRSWEEQYGWPVGHRADNGDLIGGEAHLFFAGIAPFNHGATNSRIVLVNQFGWSRDRCGNRMPAAMEFQDIRRGSDLEFGQSIYEPFGISQVETLNSGAIACVSNVCGCTGFLAQAANELLQQDLLPAEPAPGEGAAVDTPFRWPVDAPDASVFAAKSFPLVVADYTSLPKEGWPASAQEALAINGETRDRIEARNAGATARQIFERLPRNRAQMQEQIRTGSALAQSMSWDSVTEKYFLPALARVCRP